MNRCLKSQIKNRKTELSFIIPGIGSGFFCRLASIHRAELDSGHPSGGAATGGARARGGW
jgi:hypothetical protein